MSKNVKPWKRMGEAEVRYMESAVLSGVRLKRYWVNRGYSDADATKKAVNQALGMMVASALENAPRLVRDIKELCGALEREAAWDCTYCHFMPCLDIHRQDEIRIEDAGGELRVLHLTVNDLRGQAFYHNTGGLLGSLEDILVGVLGGSLPTIHMFLWHSLRDLRASAFFAFCGRYRQAFSTLRSALELAFTGIYFQGLEDEGNKEKLAKKWEDWWEKTTTLFSEGLKTAVRRGLLNEEIREDAGKLFSNLSKAVHTMAKDEYEMIMEKDKSAARPASAFFNMEFLEEWFQSLLKIVVIVRDTITASRFKHSTRSHEGLNMLNDIIKALQYGNKDAVRFIDCPNLGAKQ